MQCYFCKKEQDPKPGRRDTCTSCGRDLHVCLNCSFYDKSAYNECHETQADRVVDKDRSNFCDYFTFAEKGQNAKGLDPAADAKRKLEELFRKKT